MVTEADVGGDGGGRRRGRAAAKAKKAKAEGARPSTARARSFPRLSQHADREAHDPDRHQTARRGRERGPERKRKEAAEELRRDRRHRGKPGQPGEHVRCVVSVAMLTEGWDANNVTHILGVRAFGSQLLCEQVVGRGLRRMDYTPDPKTGLLTEEYVDVYGIPFSVIPFKGRPSKKSEPEDKPKNHVRALDEREGMEMRFPVVEGYAFALRQEPDQLRRERTWSCWRIEPNREPTATFVQPTVGYQEGSPSQSTAPVSSSWSRTGDAYYRQHPPADDQVRDRPADRGPAARSGAGTADAEAAACCGCSRATSCSRRSSASWTQYVRRKVDFQRLPTRASWGWRSTSSAMVERLRDAIEPDDVRGRAAAAADAEPLQADRAPRPRWTSRPPGPAMRPGRATSTRWCRTPGVGGERRLPAGAEPDAVAVLRPQRPSRAWLIPYEYLGVDHALRARLPGAAGERRHRGPGDQGLRGRADQGEARRGQAVGDGGEQLWPVCRNPLLLDKELAFLDRTV